MGGAVELGGSFVEFEGAVAGNGFGFGEEGGDFGGGERAKSLGGLEGLVEVGQRLAAGDNDASGKIHGVVEAIDGRDGFALENEAGAHGLHAENGDALLDGHGNNFFLEAMVVRVHDVERHLHRIVYTWERGMVSAGPAVAGGRAEARPYTTGE